MTVDEALDVRHQVRRHAIGHPTAFEASYASMHNAVRALGKRAVKSGDLRKDLDPVDLLRALVGVSNVAANPDCSRAPDDSSIF